MNPNIDKTYEDKSITDPKERAKLFGQYDHLRVYGQDYYHKLESVGFSSKNIQLQKILTNEEINQYALTKKEQIPVMLK